MSRFLILGGRVLDPANGLDANLELVVDHGMISGLFPPGHPRALASASDKTIDARGLWVLPGLVDPHVHLRQPGMTKAEDIKSGTLAAAAGGYTTIVCMPNTCPVLDSPVVVRQLLSDLATDAEIEVLIAAALSHGLNGKKATDLESLIEAGAFCWSDDGKGTQNPQVLAEALRCSEKLGRPVLVHPEVHSLSAKGVMRAGPVSNSLGLLGIPSAAERVRVERDLRLQRRYGGRLHFQHLSTEGAIAAVSRAKELGQEVTCEATPHHLLLNDLDLQRSKTSSEPDTNFKMNPPLCRPAQQKALWRALAAGTIDAIGTDHAPHTLDSKNSGFNDAPFGVIGLETSVALMLRLVRQGVVKLKRALELLTTGPAKVLGIKAGTLSVGASADICLLDPDLHWTVKPESFESKSSNTPFAGWELTGRAVLVMRSGDVVWRLHSRTNERDGGTLE